MLLHVASGFESDKVAFYVCAGALAIWAVVLSFVGLTRPSFPGNSRGGWLVIGASAALMVAAMATAVITG